MLQERGRERCHLRTKYIYFVKYHNLTIRLLCASANYTYIYIIIFCKTEEIYKPLCHVLQLIETDPTQKRKKTKERATKTLRYGYKKVASEPIKNVC